MTDLRMRLFAALALTALCLPPNAIASEAGSSLPFNAQTFARAKKEGKMVVLDLEAVWCHWCHVMDSKTYADPAVKALLSKRFLFCRIDQDSRPDLANKYEDYGWPATIVFDADAHELAKRAGYINPQKMQVLLKQLIADPYFEKGSKVKVSNKANEVATGSIPGKIPGKILGKGLSTADREMLIARHDSGHDPRYGGWGTYQKFLDADSFEYALHRHPEQAQMALAGELHLLDREFGGVYQYSTDGDWDHPHFEKIMQTQCDALRAFSLGYAAFGEQRFLDASQSIAAFLNDFLLDPSGAFYTSMDADLKQGEHSADYFSLDRSKRLALGLPHIDKHIYARENGWAIAALTQLYMAGGNTKYLDMAKRAMTTIQKSHGMESTDHNMLGFIHSSDLGIDKDQPAALFLGDTLAMAKAYLALYQATADRSYLQRASACLLFIQKHFEADSGYVTALDKNAVVPASPLLDENIGLARLANLLHQYNQSSTATAVAEHAMAYLCTPQAINKRKILVAGILLADLELNQPPLHITIVGPKQDSQAASLFAAANALPEPYKRVEWLDKKEGPLPNNDTDLPEMPRPAAFSCQQGRCSMPAYDAPTLKKMVRTIRSGSQSDAPAHN